MTAAFGVEDALAFLDAFPKVKGHAVLIPKRKARLRSNLDLGVSLAWPTKNNACRSLS